MAANSCTDAASIFRKAAAKIESGHPDGCCNVLTYFCPRNRDEKAVCICRALKDRLYTWFKEPDFGGYWWGDTTVPENQDARVVALCLLAAMVEAGDA